jgi:DNA-binding NarL/FixJ family response regulator
VAKTLDPTHLDSSSLPPGSVSILVVDDYAPWRSAICCILHRQPGLHVVAEASDGLEAIQKAERLKPELILLDIGLPSLNGIEGARRMRHLVAGEKILFVSQDNDADLVQLALRNGALGYVLKLDAASQLLPAVAAVLQGSQFVSSGIRSQSPETTVV